MTDDRRAKVQSFVRARLTEGSKPRDDWRQMLEAAWSRVMDSKVSDVVDPEQLHRLADVLLEPVLVRELARPIASRVVREVVSQMKDDSGAVGRFVSSEARADIRKLLNRPGLVHPDWIRAVFRGAAAEAVLNDTLYRALRDFSTLMPRLMIKISPMGRFAKIGGAGALAGKVVDELEKLIEPEIKSFLTGGTQRMLDRAAEFAISRLDEPESIEFRHDIAEFILNKPPKFFVHASDDEVLDAVDEIAEKIAVVVVQAEEVQSEVHAFIDRHFEAHADQTLAAVWRDELDAQRGLPMAELADATWPLVRTVLSGPAATEWLDGLVDELLDEYERA